VHEYVNRLYFNYRDHRKITVIDGETAYTGGVNIADEYANLIDRFGYWKDSGIRLEGEGVWGLTAAFLNMWSFLSGELHEERDYYRPHTSPASDGFCQPLLADVGVRHRVGVPVIRRTGQHQPDVHPAVAGDAQRAHDVLVGDKIRRRDIKEAARAADELQKGILGGVVGIILRTVEKRLAEAVRCRRGVRPVVVPLLVQLSG